MRIKQINHTIDLATFQQITELTLVMGGDLFEEGWIDNEFGLNIFIEEFKHEMFKLLEAHKKNVSTKETV